jgi:hypothetical protein
MISLNLKKVNQIKIYNKKNHQKYLKLKFQQIQKSSNRNRKHMNNMNNK